MCLFFSCLWFLVITCVVDRNIIQIIIFYKDQLFPNLLRYYEFYIISKKNFKKTIIIGIHISVYSPTTILRNASRFELLPSLRGPIKVQRGQNAQTLLKLAISMRTGPGS